MCPQVASPEVRQTHDCHLVDDGLFDCNHEQEHRWPMRHGHCRKLLQCRRPRGRTAFARTVNANAPRRHFGLGWLMKQTHRRDVQADMLWEFEAYRECDGWRPEVYDIPFAPQMDDWQICEDLDAQCWADWAGKKGVVERVGVDVCLEQVEATSTAAPGSLRSSSSDATPELCWRCCADGYALPRRGCTFCVRMTQLDSSLWAAALLRANRSAEDYFISIGCSTATSPRLRCKNEEPKNEFGQMREFFWSTYGSQIQAALGVFFLLRPVSLKPAPLAPEVENRFLSACGAGVSTPTTLPSALIPAFHGTAAHNHESIFKRGLLIANPANRLPVAHGSAHGNGIYASNCANIFMSRAYCTEDRILVCGILDDDPEVVVRHNWGRVVFDERRVVPFYEASVAHSGNIGRIAVPALPTSNGVERTRALIEVLARPRPNRCKKRLKISGVRVSTGQVEVFLSRRTARRHSLHKIPSAPLHACAKVR